MLTTFIFPGRSQTDGEELKCAAGCRSLILLPRHATSKNFGGKKLVASFPKKKKDQKDVDTFPSWLFAARGIRIAADVIIYWRSAIIP